MGREKQEENAQLYILVEEGSKGIPEGHICVHIRREVFAEIHTMSAQPRCPREEGLGCTRFRGLWRTHVRHSALAWLTLVARCIDADVTGRGLVLDRCEIKTIIAMNDEKNKEGAR